VGGWVVHAADRVSIYTSAHQNKPDISVSLGYFGSICPAESEKTGRELVRDAHSCSAVPLYRTAESYSENGSALLLLLLARCPQILQRALQRLHLFTRVA